jgi:hypothetical protein
MLPPFVRRTLDVGAADRTARGEGDDGIDRTAQLQRSTCMPQPEWSCRSVAWRMSPVGDRGLACWIPGDPGWRRPDGSSMATPARTSPCQSESIGLSWPAPSRDAGRGLGCGGCQRGMPAGKGRQSSATARQLPPGARRLLTTTFEVRWDRIALLGDSLWTRRIHHWASATPTWAGGVSRNGIARDRSPHDARLRCLLDHLALDLGRMVRLGDGAS